VLNAEDKNVVSDLTVHPASAHVNDGELYVVHNGVVDKVKVYEHLRRRYGVALRVDDPLPALKGGVSLGSWRLPRFHRGY